MPWLRVCISLQMADCYSRHLQTYMCLIKEYAIREYRSIIQCKWQEGYQDDAPLEKVVVVYSPINRLQEIDSTEASQGLEGDVHNNVVH